MRTPDAAVCALAARPPHLPSKFQTATARVVRHAITWRDSVLYAHAGSARYRPCAYRRGKPATGARRLGSGGGDSGTCCAEAPEAAARVTCLAQPLHGSGTIPLLCTIACGWMMQALSAHLVQQDVQSAPHAWPQDFGAHGVLLDIGCAKGVFVRELHARDASALDPLQPRWSFCGVELRQVREGSRPRRRRGGGWREVTERLTTKLRLWCDAGAGGRSGGGGLVRHVAVRGAGHGPWVDPTALHDVATAPSVRGAARAREGVRDVVAPGVSRVLLAQCGWL